jgi:ribonuclease J
LSPTITVYDGANTIGGNKILLEDGATAVFLDFGTSFSTRFQKV